MYTNWLYACSASLSKYKCTVYKNKLRKKNPDTNVPGCKFVQYVNLAPPPVLGVVFILLIFHRIQPLPIFCPIFRSWAVVGQFVALLLSDEIVHFVPFVLCVVSSLHPYFTIIVYNVNSFWEEKKKKKIQMFTWQTVKVMV